MTAVKHIIILILFFCLKSIAFGQENYSNQNTIDSLDTVRIHLFNEGENYLDIEREMISLGGNPNALVLKNNNSNGFELSFKTYKTIREGSENLIEDRIIQTINSIVNITLLGNNVVATFNSEAKKEDVLSLINLMGYKDFTIINK